MFEYPNILFKEETGPIPAPAGGGTPQEKPNVIEIKEGETALQTAARILENVGGKAFLNQDAYEQDYKKRNNDLIGTTYKKVHEILEEKLKFPRNDDEMTVPKGSLDRYLERYVYQTNKNKDSKEGFVSEDEFNAIKNKLQKRDEDFEEVQNKLTEYQQKIVLEKEASELSKGINSFNYKTEDVLALKGIKMALENDFRTSHKIEYDDKGVKITDPSGELMLDNQGNRVTIQHAVEKYVKSREDVSFSENGKNTGPNTNGSIMSASDKEAAIESVKAEFNKLGITDYNTTEAAKIRMSYGIGTVSDKRVLGIK